MPVTENVATSKGSSRVKDLTELVTSKSSSCHIVFDLYDECMKDVTPHGKRCCNGLRKLKEICSSRFERDPRRPSCLIGIKERDESLQRRATAKGFASVKEYIRDQNERNPRICAVTFRRYNECLLRNPTFKSVCDSWRNKCPQFKS